MNGSNIKYVIELKENLTRNFIKNDVWFRNVSEIENRLIYGTKLVFQICEHKNTSIFSQK